MFDTFPREKVSNNKVQSFNSRLYGLRETNLTQTDHLFKSLGVDFDIFLNILLFKTENKIHLNLS